MKIARKSIWKIAATAVAILCVLALCLVFVLQSNWFRDEVRKRIIAQVETATGGKVEIGKFDYDWRSRTVDLKDFVVHGTETPPADPLLHVAQIKIAVRILSVLERSADISSIVLTKPQVNLLVAPDGSTNLPTSPIARQSKDPIAELFALKLNTLVIADGLAIVNDRRIPVNLRAGGVELTAHYLKAGPSYDLVASSRQIDLGFGNLVRGPFQFNAQASLGKDRVLVQKVELTGGQSHISGSAMLENFVHPRLNFQLVGATATDEILPVAKFTYVRGGKLALKGAGHYDEKQGWSFDGKADAQQANIDSPVLTLKGINATSDVEARQSGLILRHVVATAKGARLNGEAVIKNYRDLSFDGDLSGFALREAEVFFTNKPVPWQGVASGRIHGSATLDMRSKDLAVQGDLRIAPLPSGIPVSGDVNLKYLQKANSLDFAQSHLNFPHSSLTFSGSLRGANQLVLDSSDLEDFRPIVTLLDLKMPPDAWPVLDAHGHAHFDGVISNLLTSPNVSGQLETASVRFAGQTLDQVTTKFNAGNTGIDFASLDVQQGQTRINGTGLIGLSNWTMTPDSALRAALAIRSLNIAKVAALFPKIELPIIQGIVSGTVQLRGTFAQPEGSAHIASDSLDAYGERLNQAQFDADLTGDTLQVSKGRVVSGVAVLNFSGNYARLPGNWTSGQAHIRVDSNGFPLASLSPVRKYEPAFNAHAELHFDASASVGPGKLEPTGANGTIQLSNVTWNGEPYGDLTLNSATHGPSVDTVITGDFRKNLLRGTAKVSLAAGNHTTAEIAFDRIQLASIYSLAPSHPNPLFDGNMAAKVRIEGSLQHPDQMHVSLTSDKLELSSHLTAEEPGRPKPSQFVFRNAGPLVVELFQNVATLRSFRVEGDQTGLEVTGTVPLDSKKPVDLKIAGNVNLQAYHLFDQNVESSGVSAIAASIGGTLADPTVNGTLEVKNGAFFPENIPNGLSEVNGTVVFTRNRATLQKMTAKSGGGELALTGFLSFAGGGPMIYHLEGSAENVRVRYAGSISVTVSSKLRLSGTSTKSLLSGTLTVSRVVFNTNTDVGNILAGLGSTSAAPGGENEFLTGLHLDVAIESAQNLQLSTSLSRDVEAEINLRLRGTPDLSLIHI